MPVRARSSSSWTARSASRSRRSASQALVARSMRSCSARSSSSSRSRRSPDSTSASALSAWSSTSSWSLRRRWPSISSGRLSSCTRMRLAASSIRSIAESGSRRSLTYRWAKVAAAITAGSVMATPWWTSYFSLRPRRMLTVSSTDGSSTKIGWNRRSSAASFSIWRYSSSVVAPIMRSSPRASAGLSMLPASTAPSAFPAPTIVCSSSMNSTTSPAERVVSSTTPLSRSSNSPRYLAPASRLPMSSCTTRLPSRPSGTSLLTMRCAKPSAIAVLPTPGSPISTGLFLVRRSRIWIARRISSSRPITGSSLPSAARWVRSMPYFSSASKRDSAVRESTVAPARTSLAAASRASAGGRASRAAPVVRRSATNRASAATNASPHVRATRSASSKARPTSAATYASASPLTRGRRASAASSAAWTWGRSPPARSRTRAGGCWASASSARARCSAPTWPWRRVWAICCALATSCSVVSVRRFASMAAA